MNQHVPPDRLFDDGRDGPAEQGSGSDKGARSDSTFAAGTKQRRNLKRPILAVAVVAILGASGIYSWHYWTVGRFEESTDDAYVQADSTIIAPKVSGYLRAVFVADNQSVTANQPLAQIDDRDYVVALKQAQANVDAAEATLDNIGASINQQHSVVDQARSTVTLDQANLTFAQQENDRYSTLANQGSGSVQSAQQARSKLDIAKATLQRDTAAVSAAERQIQVLQAQLAKARAELMHDQAAEQQAQLNLSYTTILAPIGGVVGNRTLRIGQYVQAGTALMSVVPLLSVYIIANYKETQLADVRAGQPVTIEVDGLPGRDLRGTVDSIAPASGQEFALLPPDNATGNFTKVVQRIPVRIVVAPDNPLAGLMRPGMSVEPTIDTKPKAHTNAPAVR